MRSIAWRYPSMSTGPARTALAVEGVGQHPPMARGCASMVQRMLRSLLAEVADGCPWLVAPSEPGHADHGVAGDDRRPASFVFFWWYRGGLRRLLLVEHHAARVRGGVPAPGSRRRPAGPADLVQHGARFGARRGRGLQVLVPVGPRPIMVSLCTSSAAQMMLCTVGVFSSDHQVPVMPRKLEAELEQRRRGRRRAGAGGRPGRSRPGPPAARRSPAATPPRPCGSPRRRTRPPSGPGPRGRPRSPRRGARPARSRGQRGLPRTLAAPAGTTRAV